MKRALALTLLIVSLAVFSGIATSDARALNPEQTSVPNTVNIVYWDLVRFWIPRTNPSLQYYDNGYADYWALCSPAVWTRDMYGWEGMSCNGRIYLDYYQQVGNIGRYGDGSVAFWLAHEFAHHIELLLGINWSAFLPYHELLADCFAGMYFRHAVYTSHALNYNDYRYDARNQIWALPASDAVHGNPQQRLRAFDYGFTQTTYSSCINGAGAKY